MMPNKYLSIYSDLIGQIEQGTYGPDQLLPSESELIKHYEVSRDTIRKSLDLLAQHGYILKVKGKGSFVLDNQKLDFPVTGVVSFKEISQRSGQAFETRVESLQLLEATPKARKRLNLEAGEEFYRLARTRIIDGEAIILDKDYLLASRVPGLTAEIAAHSIYDYIEGELSLKIAYANKEITAQRATEEDRRLMDLQDYDLVIVVRSYTYLEDLTLFQYTESRHRPDKFKFVDFAKR